MQTASMQQLPQSGTPSSFTTLSKTFSSGLESFTFTVNYDPRTNRVVYIWSIEVRHQNGTRTHMPADDNSRAMIPQLNWKAVYEKEQSNAEFERMMAAHELETRYTYMNMYEAA